MNLTPNLSPFLKMEKSDIFLIIYANIIKSKHRIDENIEILKKIKSQ